MIAHNGSDRVPVPIWKLAVSWVLVLPLFYFSTGGRPLSDLLENATSESPFSLVAAQPNTAEHAAEASIIFGILAAVMFPVIWKVIVGLRNDGIFAALAILAIASSMWSQFPKETLEWSICLAINTLVGFYLCRRFSPDKQMALLLMFGWICLILSALLLIVPGVHKDYAHPGAWAQIYGFKNRSAPMTVYLMSVALYTPAINFLAKALRFIYIGFSIVFVVMSQSRGGWTLLACLLSYYCAVRIAQAFRSKDRQIAFILLAVIAFSCGVLIFSYRNAIVYLLGKDPSLTGRTEIWRSIMASAMKRPVLGYGYQGFWHGGLQGESANVSLACRWAVTGAHNGFLNIWLTLGAVGLGLLLYSFLRSLRNGLLCIRTLRSPYLTWCLSVVLVTILQSLDETRTMAPNDLTWILYILASVGLAEGAHRIRTGLDHG